MSTTHDVDERSGALHERAVAILADMNRGRDRMARDYTEAEYLQALEQAQNAGAGETSTDGESAADHPAFADAIATLGANGPPDEPSLHPHWEIDRRLWAAGRYPGYTAREYQEAALEIEAEDSGRSVRADLRLI